MPSHEPSARRRARPASSNRVSALALALVVACSGTDVGYPRYIVIERATGGSDAAGAGADPNPLGGGSGGDGGSAATAPTGGDGSAAGGTLSSGSSGDGGSTALGGSGGKAGSASGGSGARAGTKGAGGGSGASGSGTAGSGGDGATGGANTGGAAGSGGTTTADFPWPDVYDAASTPAPADGHHNAGASCMLSSCHGTKVPFLFGGTVYQADGVTAAPGVEVGIADGTVTLTAYSAANGNVWLPASAGTLDFTRAVIALRNATGELQKPADAPRDVSCNGSGCHASTNRMLEP